MLVVVPFTANADEKNIAETGDTVASGTTGDCTWKIEGTTLTISGNGKTGSYDYDNPAPWRKYNITEAVIEKGVTSIGNYAFLGCTSLTSIDIPDSVTSIGNSAFSGCSSLTSVTIPDSVTSIGNSVFYRCSSLTSVTIPDSVTSIGHHDTFSGCTSLTSVTIGNSVTGIGISAFYNCTSLTSVTIGNSVTSISNFAFSGCSSLKSVTIPDSVTIIGGGAFEGCISLTSVHISDIAAWCSIDFSYSDSNPLNYAQNLYLNDDLITELVIPDTVTDIKKYAFSNYIGLTSVTIPDSVTCINSQAFYGCTSLTSVTIPDSVEAIANMAFYNCTSLTSVTIPASVTDIYDKAFGESKVKDFTIYGYKNSEAERYAKDNNFKFIALDDEPSDPTKTTDREFFGDIDGDGEVSVIDATFIQRYVTKFQTPYPIGNKMK